MKKKKKKKKKLKVSSVTALIFTVHLPKKRELIPQKDRSNNNILSLLPDNYNPPFNVKYT